VPKTGIIIPASPERHWEWRVFGRLPAQPLAGLEGAAPAKPKKELVDRYLWRPQCPANIKIRKGALKIKELVRVTRDGFELWIESRDLKFTFPLDRQAIDKLRESMHLTTPPQVLAGCAAAPEFLRTLRQLEPDLRVVKVRKQREHFKLAVDGVRVSIELAQIDSPLQVESLCIESEAACDQEQEVRFLKALRHVKDRLRLPSTLQVMGYTGFLGSLERG